MDKKEYLQTAVEQIRCIKARDAVKQELEHHIEDQTEAFMMDGMKQEEASIQAVKEMGDPVEAGVALDLVHRPKMQWKMIVLVIGLSLLGVVLQYVICTSIGSENYYIWSQPKHILLGITVMLVFCFLDYSRIGLYGKLGAAGILALAVFTNLFGTMINGQSGIIIFSSMDINFTIHRLLYLYIPFFGGILYSYKGQGRKALWKSIAWMAAPCCAACSMQNFELVVCMLLIMMIQLYVVVKKGWFVDTAKALKVTTAFIITILTACVGYFVIFSVQSSDDYVMQMTRELLKESIWIGQGTDAIGNVLIQINSNFIMTYITSYFGVFPCILLLVILGGLIYWMLKISISQKNQLGMIMGLGCSLVFATQIVLYVLMNMSMFPISLTPVFLPLFSYGGTGTLVSFALIGILLSIYRYQNVLPVSPVKKREIALKM